MKYSVLLFLMCLTVSSYSQETKQNDSTYITSFKHKIMLKANINTQTQSYSIQKNDTENFSLSANNNFKFILSANYEFLGLSIAFSPKARNLPYKTAFQDIQVRLFLKQWIQNFQYRRVRGFYRDGELLEGVQNEFPNFKTISWNGATSYVINPNFSLKHVLFNTEWQRKSAGSLIPTLRYGYQRISDYVDNEKEVQNFYNISIASDYYHTWVLEKNWFVTPSISPAIGLRFTNSVLGENNTQDTLFTTSLNLGLYFGYTSSNIVAGANFNFDSKASNAKTKTNIISDRSYAKLYFGYRFNAPNSLKKKANWIKNKVKG
ncbi:DUF4421 family protein [Lacinutrix jangbogonensis]|uniref:DUF4421 family protein n=1 Tax=Lacinutrix jangbogonensis TaxID=1469557 RepID=UPI0009DE21DA|nr:DUF4421 family protein [Lacinutrix jangbogonensis]